MAFFRASPQAEYHLQIGLPDQKPLNQLKIGYSMNRGHQQRG